VDAFKGEALPDDDLGPGRVLVGWVTPWSHDERRFGLFLPWCLHENKDFDGVADG
jgi:hypothetical protein